MKLDAIRNAFPQGARVRLISMYGEPQMPRGLEGTVNHVDDAGQIHVHWDNGSGLALNQDVDAFTIVEAKEEANLERAKVLLWNMFDMLMSDWNPETLSMSELLSELGTTGEEARKGLL